MKFTFEQEKVGLYATLVLFFVVLALFEWFTSSFFSGSPTLLKNEESKLQNLSFFDLKPPLSKVKPLSPPTPEMPPIPPISKVKPLDAPIPESPHSNAPKNVSDSELSRCHIYDGKWKKKKSMPLYNGKNCSWLSQYWACKRGKNSTFDYEKYSWKPEGCKLPEFQRENFLEEFKNQTVTFSGDSLGRQQFQSFLCLVDPDKDHPEKMEDMGYSDSFFTPKGKRGPHAYRFTRLNLTVMFFGSDSLCELKDSDPAIGKDGKKGKRVELHIDQIQLELKKLVQESTTVVFNTMHHWSGDKFDQNGWVIYFDNKELPRSHKFSNLKTARNVCVNHTIHWLDSEVKRREREGRNLLAVFRTYSPRHFTQGDWNSGGTCTQVKFGESLPENTADLPAISAAKGKRVVVLDITAMSNLRGESHLGEWDQFKKRKGMDCLHWCLPGVPDFWNVLLYWESYRQSKRI